MHAERSVEAGGRGSKSAALPTPRARAGLSLSPTWADGSLVARRHRSQNGRSTSCRVRQHAPRCSCPGPGVRCYPRPPASSQVLGHRSVLGRSEHIPFGAASRPGLGQGVVFRYGRAARPSSPELVFGESSWSRSAASFAICSVTSGCDSGAVPTSRASCPITPGGDSGIGVAAGGVAVGSWRSLSRIARCWKSLSGSRIRDWFPSTHSTRTVCGATIAESTAEPTAAEATLPAIPGRAARATD